MQPLHDGRNHSGEKWEEKRMINEIGILAIAYTITCSSIGIGADIYEYDILNRLTKVTYEDGSYVEYEYDDNGNITKTNMYDATPETDDSGESEETGESTEEPPTDTEESTEESGGSTEESGGAEGEDNVITKIISAIQEIVTEIINWIQNLF